jgi:hypothetical protein
MDDGLNKLNAGLARECSLACFPYKNQMEIITSVCRPASTNGEIFVKCSMHMIPLDSSNDTSSAKLADLNVLCFSTVHILCPICQFVKYSQTLPSKYNASHFPEMRFYSYVYILALC